MDAASAPSVPFLNPTGVDNPLAISRCVCDSVVRAPIAVQVINSDKYCGMIGSSASVPAGRPSSATNSSNSRASNMPFSMWKESSRSGSLIKPFHPTVVRGFSKYTRMINSSVELTRSAKALRRAAYSRAAATS